MKLPLSSHKRLILSLFTLSAVFLLFILNALQTSAQKATTSSQANGDFLPTYIPKSEIRHAFPNLDVAVTDPVRKRMYATYWGNLTSFDVQNGTVENTTTAVYRPANLLLSPDGSRLFVSSHVTTEDGRITILDTETLAIMATHVYTNPNDYPYYSNIHAMAVGPTNKLFIAPSGTSSGNSIDTMDISTGAILASQPFSGKVISLASHDDTLYATHIKDQQGNLYKFDISTGFPISVTAVPITSPGTLTISPDGANLIINDSDGVIYQYNADSLEVVHTFSIDLTYGFIDVDVLADNQHLVGLYRATGFYGVGGAQAFDLASGELVRSFKDIGDMTQVHYLAAFADNDIAMLYSGGIRLFSPADHAIALPVVYNKYCTSPIYDDFSYDTSGWPVQDTGSVIYRYLTGEYNIFHQYANRWAAASRGNVWNKSKLVEIDGRLAQNAGMWGLLFGLNDDWTDFYTFEISPLEQRWFIFHYTSSAGWGLVNQGVNGVIQPGGNLNRLSIKASHSLEFQINGVPVDYRYELLTRTGRVGVTAGSFQNQVDIRYDNYLFVDETCPLPGQNLNGGGMEESMSLQRPSIDQILPERPTP